MPGFSYTSVDPIITNRGIPSLFGSGFRLDSSYTKVSLGPVIPLCSASMTTIISPQEGNDFGAKAGAGALQTTLLLLPVLLLVF